MFKIKILFFLLCFNLISAQTEESENQENVSFQIIEDVPIFPGCEEISMKERKRCFQEKIQEHIKINFRYPRAAIKDKIQGKVFISFIIEKDGNVNISNIRGPHPILENEAKRIFSLLPKMIPGYQKGKPVRMTMSIPLTFKLT
ncbi:energy transducer TonB [Flavobacterium lacus]|jgi:periplasmic protein TonB|uniref:TonB family protein n=1 Tax=Flavobacterium lacus TaxID=1353778 RepID=A0A328WVM9_9FLAO|nr:energy transducer TonB [Flavobacterium lacus]RAR50252.1 TonB family protein [Flavobacterium lacus]